ncbi:hypothetical protein N7414_09290 [Pseudomonas sp. GD04087]|uniref:hypothetical protein n=1 Tax=unclassified Pseudomonas TaxID=196821 RepID=UPI00244B277A|nr:MULTISPECIES: hypothetical protein [unclassified Pseudomonas]MDH0289307.1 hypothetical protein [Pseudomonas sp. GD04087]MDH1052891.1 hypothetical protein [Pseudomonas sp. GD03903]MDH2002626.1 hypothetical protein [Pseudomonas sp. GD03691]
MTWYVASIVSTIELLEEVQTEFPVFEDFYLFEAMSEPELKEKISKKILLIEAAGNCSLDGKPARQRCTGVRKTRSIYNSIEDDIDQSPPADGAELTHSFFIAKSLDDAVLFSQGKRVTLDCVDDCDE